MEKVYVFKNSSGKYRAHPAVVIVNGGGKFRVVNATGVTITVTIPKGASKPNDDLVVEIPSEGGENITTRKQGDDRTRAYSYKAATSSGKRAHGNSDPVLIIEN